MRIRLALDSPHMRRYLRPCVRSEHGLIMAVSPLAVLERTLYSTFSLSLSPVCPSPERRASRPACSSFPDYGRPRTRLAHGLEEGHGPCRGMRCARRVQTGHSLSSDSDGGSRLPINLSLTSSVFSQTPTFRCLCALQTLAVDELCEPGTLHLFHPYAHPVFTLTTIDGKLDGY